MNITFEATSFEDYKTKVKAIIALDMRFVETTLSGYFSEQTDAQYKEYCEATEYCNNLSMIKTDDAVHYDDDTSTESYDKVTKVDRVWIHTTQGLKVRFPRNPDTSLSWHTAATIFIECEQNK